MAGSRTGDRVTKRSSAGANQGPAQMAFLEGQLAEIKTLSSIRAVLASDACAVREDSRGGGMLL